MPKKKNKRRLKDLQESVTALHGRMASVQSYLEKLCKHLGIPYGTTVSLTSFDHILKEMYPAHVPQKLAGLIPMPVADRVELDKEARMARAEEIAARMFQENDFSDGVQFDGQKYADHDERDVVIPKNKNIEELEKKLRIPPNLELGF